MNTMIMYLLLYTGLICICYRALVARYKYDPAENIAIGYHTGDSKLMIVSFIEVLIVNSLVAIAIKYSILAVLELAIIVTSFFA